MLAAMRGLGCRMWGHRWAIRRAPDYPSSDHLIEMYCRSCRVTEQQLWERESLTQGVVRDGR